MPNILPENKLLMRVSQGSATIKDDEGKERKVELFTTIHGSPIIQFDDRTTVYWDWSELIGTAWNTAKRKTH
ncbi:hypothetical protein [Oceanobacillus sp. CFH 90083]|uniref:hypothetical protein n=1 Tax=Oceanobacillus sp. CFH 90083 TaxID=2592336 RepID=UPI00128B5A91|nr:hypothetical protein [Oceanobacillus sp. CFH 90083]